MQQARSPDDILSGEGNSRAQDREAQSTLDLMRRLLNEVSTLFRQELTLARAEFMRSISRVLVSATSIAAGGAVLYAGLLVLLAAAVLGLSKVLEPWLAALIIGVVVGVIGYVMLHAGIKKMSNTSVKPELTQDSLKRDKDVLMRKEP
ncbi:MAG TPA: phage holin family protein [Steroidobacteraceae bacterium]|nr:phage holin family protein [Steroidobacteraceae bacterium]